MYINHHDLNMFATCSKDLVESDHWPPVCVSMELDLSDNEISAPWIKNVCGGFNPGASTWVFP